MLKSENLVTDPKIQLLGRGLSLGTGLHRSLKKLIEQVCFTLKISYKSVIKRGGIMESLNR